MALDLLQIISVLFHFFGMLLISLAYINIAVLVHLGCSKKIEGCKHIPGTRLLMPPFLIALGAVGFLFISFMFILSMITLNSGLSLYLRYFATGTALVGNLLALYGVTSFFKQAKSAFSGGK